MSEALNKPGGAGASHVAVGGTPTVRGPRPIGKVASETPAEDSGTPQGARKMEPREVRRILEANVRSLGKSVKRPKATIGKFEVSELNKSWVMIDQPGTDFMMAIPREVLDRELEEIWRKYF